MLHPPGVTAPSGLDSRTSAIDFDAAPLRNHLLASLDPPALAGLRPYMETLHLEQHEVLFEANAPLSHVYFPDNAGVSLVNVAESGTSMAGTVGCEGMVGIGAFLGEDRSSLRASTHLAGTSRRLTVAAFRQLLAASGPLHRLMLRYTHAFLSQIIQTQQCNSSHPVEQRCARWILLTAERADAMEFPLSPEELALVVGVHRGGVLLGVRALEQRGLIEYRRSRLQILDRRTLGEIACKCHWTLPIE